MKADSTIKMTENPSNPFNYTLTMEIDGKKIEKDFVPLSKVSETIYFMKKELVEGNKKDILTKDEMIISELVLLIERLDEPTLDEIKQHIVFLDKKSDNRISDIFRKIGELTNTYLNDELKGNNNG